MSGVRLLTGCLACRACSLLAHRPRAGAALPEPSDAARALARRVGAVQPGRDRKRQSPFKLDAAPPGRAVTLEQRVRGRIPGPAPDRRLDARADDSLNLVDARAGCCSTSPRSSSSVPLSSRMLRESSRPRFHAAAGRRSGNATAQAGANEIDRPGGAGSSLNVTGAPVAVRVRQLPYANQRPRRIVRLGQQAAQDAVRPR